VKTHYALLGVDPTADIHTIKKAFRQEIALYHPDKVAHLGREFQEMASARAAELTIAYSTLTDPAARATYDAGLVAGAPVAPAAATPAEPPIAPSPAAAPHAPTSQSAASESTRTEPAQTGRSYERERVGRDDIMRRASLGRVRAALKDVIGEYDTTPVKGFDLAFVSRAKSSLFRKATRPSLLVKLATEVDAALIADACANAVKAKIEQKPLAILLLADKHAPTGELGGAIEEFRRRNRSLVDSVFPVPIDVRDWSAKIPSNAPGEVRAVIEKLKNLTGSEF
jgi:hypothetical protein